MPWTRSAARAEAKAARDEAEADEPRKRMKTQGTADVTRQLDPMRPGAGAAQAAVAPYAEDIHEYHRSLEVKMLERPSADSFCEIHKDFSLGDRAVLVNWLVEVAEEFELKAETLYLAVSYVDRFLSTDTITREKLQLMGVTAFFSRSVPCRVSLPYSLLRNMKNMRFIRWR